MVTPSSLPLLSLLTFLELIAGSDPTSADTYTPEPQPPRTPSTPLALTAHSTHKHTHTQIDIKAKDIVLTLVPINALQQLTEWISIISSQCCSESPEEKKTPWVSLFGRWVFDVIPTLMMQIPLCKPVLWLILNDALWGFTCCTSRIISFYPESARLKGETMYLIKKTASVIEIQWCSFNQRWDWS